MGDKIKRGYKASDDGVCRDMTYEVGETYEKTHNPVMCGYGFHYCEIIDDVFSYYEYQKGVTKIFEIEDLGETITNVDKSVTNKIRIVREIPFEEYNTLFKRHKFDEKKNLVYREHCGTLNRISTFTYDQKDRLIKKEDSTGYWQTYQYDENGNIRQSDCGYTSIEIKIT